MDVERLVKISRDNMVPIGRLTTEFLLPSEV